MTGEEAILQPLAGTSVMAGAGDQLLFAGILQEVQIAHEGAAYHVELTGVSRSKQHKSHFDITGFRVIMKGKKLGEEDILSLYNALNGTSYDNPDDLTITTIGDVIYIKMKKCIQKAYVRKAARKVVKKVLGHWYAV